MSSGSPTRGVLRIENGSDRELLVAGGCEPVEHGLYLEGKWLGGGPFNRTCPTIVGANPPKRVEPGMSVELSFVLDALRASDQNYERLPLPAGSYGVTAGVHSPDDDGFWFAPVRVVSVPTEPPLPGTANATSPTFQPPSGVRIEVKPAAARVARGATLSGTLTVTNGSGRSIRFHRECDRWWGLYSSAGVFMGGRKDSACSSDAGISSLDPGQSVVLEVTFDTSSYRHHVKSPDEQLPPGKYVASGGIYAVDDQEHWAAAPVEVEVN